MTSSGLVAQAPGSRLPALSSTASLGTVGLLAGISVWELGARAVDAVLLPPFSAVVARLVELALSGQIAASLAVSLGNLALGLLISLSVGIVLGSAMGWWRSVDYALGPYVNALLTAPSLVFAPIFFSFWGVDRGSIVALIVTYAVFVVIVNTSVAVKSIPTDLTEMAVSYNATRRQVFRFIVMPAAMPLIMAGVRLAVGRAVKGMINGEMFIAVVGLGRLIVSSGRQLDVATVLAVLIVVVAVALVLMRIVWLVEQRFTGWLPETRRTG
jgi:NitT/TauT family transport system permease protein